MKIRNDREQRERTQRYWRMLSARRWQEAFVAAVAHELRAVPDFDVLEPFEEPVVPNRLRVRWADCEFDVQVTRVEHAP